MRSNNLPPARDIAENLNNKVKRYIRKWLSIPVSPSSES